MASTQDVLDDAVDTAQSGLHTVRTTTNRAIDRVADSLNGWRDEAAPVVDRLTTRATQAARQSADWVRDNSERVRRQVAQSSDRAVGYVRDEPVRSALMAVAAGAAIYALVRLFASRRER